MQSRFTAPGALSALVALAACSSGGSAPAVPVAAPVAAPTASAASGAALAPAQSAGTPSFTFASPGYVSPSTRSVTVTLTAVNGVAPAGSTHSLTTNLSGCATSCTVLGPSAPVGNDTFAFALHDAAGGAGKVLGVATQTLAIVAGNAAHASVAARGVPSTFAIQNIPTAQAGAPFAAPKPVKVAVKDADGNVISGTYAVTVWIDDLDSTHATSFTASGTDAPPAGQLFSSTDAVTLSYNGLAIAPATLMVSATNSTNFSATFAPVPSPLVYQGPTSQGNPQVDLYAAAGTGSSAAFSVSEQGWSNAPFGKSFSASAASSCAQIATVSPASGTSFTVRAVAAPTVGSCAVTVADGLGHSRVVTVTFSTTSFSGS